MLKVQANPLLVACILAMMITRFNITQHWYFICRIMTKDSAGILKLNRPTSFWLRVIWQWLFYPI
jgi:hypothetical protein